MKRLIFLLLLVLSFLILKLSFSPTTSPVRAQAGPPTCQSFSVTPVAGPSNSNFTITATNCQSPGANNFTLGIDDANGTTFFQREINVPAVPGQLFGINIVLPNMPSVGTFTALLVQPNGLEEVLCGTSRCQATFIVSSIHAPNCLDYVLSDANSGCPADCPAYCQTNDFTHERTCQCVYNKTCMSQCKANCNPDEDEDLFTACNQVPSLSKCCTFNPILQYCEGPSGPPTNRHTEYLNTAIGCVPYLSQNAISITILRIALGIVGGTGLILIAIAVFMIMTSSGDPRRYAGGAELLASAILGIIMIVFSVFILHVIGVNILGVL